MTPRRNKGKVSPSLLPFGRRFRRFREAMGWSQENLAARARGGQGVTPQYIGAIETGRTRCTLEFAKEMDEALKANGELVALWEDLVKDAAFPVWFDWVSIEESAGALESWQTMLVHGLLQTPAYATALLHGNAEAIEARLKRQEILAREDPPDCTFLLDEGVLYREVGGPEVMRDQLEHLLNPSSDRITVQVVPSHGEHIGNVGSFTCATLEDLTEVAYVETVARFHDGRDRGHHRGASCAQGDTLSCTTRRPVGRLDFKNGEGQMDLNDLRWRKASRSASNGGECVELASAAGVVAVRDSKDPDGPKLVVGRNEFATLMAALKH